jgi:hypothetical protein
VKLSSVPVGIAAGLITSFVCPAADEDEEMTPLLGGAGKTIRWSAAKAVVGWAVVATGAWRGRP